MAPATSPAGQSEDGPKAAVLRQPPRDARVEANHGCTAPVHRALSEQRRADLWRSIALLTCLAALVLCVLCVRAARSEERILVLDPAGNILSGPTEQLAESRGFFTTTALYCVNTALQRSPEGFDLYELLRVYFSPRAVQRLEEHWQQQKEDAKARNLQQKPVVDTVGEPVKAGSLRVVETRGRLVRAGAYAGRSFYEEVPFILILSFRRNPELGKAAAYPWLCEDVDLEIREPGHE